MINSANEIPAAPFYVMSNDRYMSGWGRAEGAINTVILPCADYAEAQRVADYAESRGDQSRVRIVSNRPRFRPGHVYSLLARNKAKAWYPPPDYEACYKARLYKV